MQGADSAESYDAYLRPRPQGRKAGQARARRMEIKADEAEWAKAQGADTAEGYEAYLKSLPQGRQAGEARVRLAEIKADEAEWTKTQGANSAESYEAYLKSRPQGRHAREARVMVAEIGVDESAWHAAKNARHRESYQKYLDLRPKGRHAEEAAAAIAEIDRDWLIAEKDDTLGAYEKYLGANLAGHYAEEARKRIRDLTAWKRIEELSGDLPRSVPRSQKAKAAAENVPAALRNYLDQYPDGRRRREAQEMLLKLARAAREEACAAYARKAVDDAQANLRDACNLDGQGWSGILLVERSWCMSRPEDEVAATSVRRTDDLRECVTRKTRSADWERARTENRNQIQALEVFLNKYSQGPEVELARTLLAAKKMEQLQRTCRGFSEKAVQWAKVNKDEPCNFVDGRWSNEPKMHYEWCLTAGAVESEKEQLRRKNEIDACTAPRREREAWQGADDEKTISSYSSYLTRWPKGVHVAAAAEARAKLCQARWSTNPSSRNWEELTLFVEGSCADSGNSSAAKKLRDNIDRAEWARAERADSKAAFARYIRQTGGMADAADCDGPELMWGVGNGARANDAAALIADFCAWERAIADNTADGYEQYLQQIDKGRFKREAEKRKAARRQSTSVPQGFQ